MTTPAPADHDIGCSDDSADPDDDLPAEHHVAGAGDHLPGSLRQQQRGPSSNTTPAVNPPDSTTTVQPVPEPPTVGVPNGAVRDVVARDGRSRGSDHATTGHRRRHGLCINDPAGAKLLMQNVDAYHYPIPFEAFYDW